MTTEAVLEMIRQGENDAKGTAKKAAAPTAKQLMSDLEDTFRIVTGKAPHGLMVAEHRQPDGGVEYGLFFNGVAKPNKSVAVTAAGDFLVNGKWRPDHLPVIRQIARDAVRSNKEALKP